MAHEKGCPRGFWTQTVNASALELGAASGFEFVILDMEHGTGMGASGADAMIALGTRLGLAVLVRVAESSRTPVQHALDAGAAGVILPQIESARHAAQAAELTKYPPLGRRGFGYGRTMYAGVDSDFPARENGRTRCHVMIETPGALRDVDEIAALPCVDGLFIGPADLSLSSRRGFYAGTTADREDHRRIAAAARRAGKEWAMPATSREAAAFARDEGATFLAVADDLTALRAGFEAALAATAP